ncbi:MAG: adenosylcobinamide-phosphate synthase CbiB [Burkholderiaceae bacterium]
MPDPQTLLLPMALLLALALDHLFGEPPARIHPVVWMGAALGWAGARVAPLAGEAGGNHFKQNLKVFWHAALYWCALSVIAFVVAFALQTVCLAAPPWVGALGLALCLKPLMAWRMLRTDVLAVEAALAQSLAAGRERLGWLVSRDVAQLTEGQVRESAIESLAENLNDSVVAPLFWFAVAGLPGAALYRFANTADAMWGYRTVRGGREWEWAGKWAARADDALNWLPARLTALLLWPVGQGVALWRNAGLTPSPNGGWPMGAMALGLGVRLGKSGVYTLNATGREPVAADVHKAVALAWRGVWRAATVLACGLLAAQWMGVGLPWMP